MYNALRRRLSTRFQRLVCIQRELIEHVQSNYRMGKQTLFPLLMMCVLLIVDILKLFHDLKRIVVLIPCLMLSRVSLTFIFLLASLYQTVPTLKRHSSTQQHACIWLCVLGDTVTYCSYVLGHYSLGVWNCVTTKNKCNDGTH